MEKMKIINKVKDAIFEKISYTNRDYNSIITELIELLPELSPNWNNVSEADIIFIMLSLMAAHKDILNYMIDYRTLEGYMSTAKERQSLVRIANSFGYKIPSYKAPYARLRLESAELSAGGTPSFPLTLESWAKLNDIDGVAWSYTGNETTINIDDVIEVYQGIPSSINFSVANIDEQSKTHIVSNQSIAIGNNANDKGLSKLIVTKDGESDVIFTEVENVYTDTSGSNLIYHLAVDPQGITYIKFLDTFNKQDYDGFTATFFYVLTQGQNITSIESSEAVILDNNGAGTNANFFIPSTGLNFVAGSRPLTAPEIREGFKQYYAGFDSLVTLNDYRSFILNKQRAVPGLEKCLVIDSQTSTMQGLNGNAAFADSPGIYVLKENNTQLSAAELELLREAVNKVKVTGVIPSYNGESVGNALEPVIIRIEVNKLPTNETQKQNFIKFIADYINGKEIGSTLTSSELLSLIQNSEFGPNFENGIAIALKNLTTGVESRQRLNIAYNRYMTCNIATGVVENTSL